MKVLVVDNYDSFTFNLVHLVEKILNQKAEVVKNDRVNLSKLGEYHRVLLSPGPGLPGESGQLISVIRQSAGLIPVLGVCLGHQAIAMAFGGRLLNLPEVFHGLSTPVTVLDRHNLLFRGLPETIMVGRYHSWVVDPVSLPATLKVTAVDTEGNIMAMQHLEHDICSVQFHPESIMTPDGEVIIRNWLLKP